MRSRFAVQGHPIHPMLITVPIGLFIWALVSDFVFLGTDNPVWFEIARWTGVAAIVTALVAAIPGFGDFLTMGLTGRAKQTATAHMLLNLTVVSAYIAAALLMFSDFLWTPGEPVPETFIYIATALHAFGVVLLAVSGWLGGELVYRHRLGIMTGATPEVATEGRGTADASDGGRQRAREEAQRQERERTSR